MVTIKQTQVTERELSTPEEIGAHLLAEYARRQAAAPVRAGQLARLTRRDGIFPDWGVGDVVVVQSCDPENGPQALVYGLTTAGVVIQFQAIAANLVPVQD